MIFFLYGFKNSKLGNYKTAVIDEFGIASYELFPFFLPISITLLYKITHEEHT